MTAMLGDKLLTRSKTISTVAGMSWTASRARSKTAIAPVFPGSIPIIIISKKQGSLASRYISISKIEEPSISIYIGPVNPDVLYN